MRRPSTEQDMNASGASGTQSKLPASARAIIEAHESDSNLARTFNHAVVLTLAGALDTDKLRKALQQVIGRHPILHSRLNQQRSDWAAIESIDTLINFEIPSVQSAGQAEMQLLQNISVHQQTPMNLCVEAPFRTQLYRFDDANHALVLFAHELIADASTLGSVAIDMANHYNENTPSDHSIAVSDLPVSQQDRAESVSYWIEKTAGDTRSTRLHRRRKAASSLASERIDLPVSARTTQKLDVLARSEQVGLYSILVTALCVLVARLNQESEITLHCHQPADPFTLAVPAQMMPVRFDIDLNATGQEVVQAVNAALNEAFAHPLDDAQSLAGIAKRVSGNDASEGDTDDPASPVGAGLAISLVHSLDDSRFAMNGLQTSAVTVAAPHHRNLFDLRILEQGDELQLECQYNTSRYDDHSVTSWLGGYRAILKGLIDEKWLPVGILEILDPRHEKLLNEFATGPAQSLGAFDTSVLRQFGEASDEGLALHSPGKVATFKGMDLISSQIASLLRKRNLQAGDSVAILLNDKVHRAVASWACLKAGIACISLPPMLAPRSQMTLTEKANAKYLISNSQIPRSPSWDGSNTLLLDTQHEQLSVEPADQPGELIKSDGEDPQAAWYAVQAAPSTAAGQDICTSVSSQVVASLFNRLAPIAGFNGNDRILCVDSSSNEVEPLLTLAVNAAGASALLADTDTLASSGALNSFLQEAQATGVIAPARVFTRLLKSDWSPAPGFKAIVTGPALPAATAERLLEICDGIVRLFGDAESGYCAIAGKIESPMQHQELGKPQANVIVRVLDERAQPCPIGTPGEILIGGPGISAGYINAPLLTTKCFIPDVFADTPGTRLYRTGVTGRWTIDGILETV